MTAIINRIKSISKIQIIAIVLIVVGLVIATRYGIRAFNTYREFQYARINNFESGNPDTKLIRPWMTMRYVAVTYAVPQEYLFHETGIPMERGTGVTSLDKLSDQYGFERGSVDRDLIVKLQEAIIAYRENPVPTGLTENGVRPWMTIQYISNSAGIPVEVIFQQLGITMSDEYANTPLDPLSNKIKYEGGLKALSDAIQRIIDNYKQTP